MNKFCAYVRDERGIVLLTVLLLLSLLMIAGMGAVASVQNDLRTSGNLRSATTAFYLAEAGIEWGKQQIARIVVHPPVLPDRSQQFASGSFSVGSLGSTAITSLQSRLVLRSVGSTNNASQSIQASITKTYDLADGAVVLRGKARTLNFSGVSFSISGIDHDLTSGLALATARARAGLTVDAAALMNQVKNSLDDAQKRSIIGGGKDGVITVSRLIPPQDIGRVATELCLSPGAEKMGVGPAGLLAIENQIWGSRETPELRCIQGISRSDDSVVFGRRVSGVGILVIRDVGVVLSEDFHWHGLMVISGNDVGLRVNGSAKKEIRGALFVHESGNATGSGPALLDLQGTIDIRFSRGALDLAAGLIPRPTLAASYENLPLTLRQDYWRSLTP